MKITWADANAFQMLPKFAFRFRQSQQIQPTQLTQTAVPNWRLVVGQPHSLNGEFTWRDAGIAVVNAPIAFSPSQRFVVIGNADLSSYMRSNSAHAASSVQGTKAALSDPALSFIAQEWEERGPAILGDLCGMFAFSVWDRDQQDLRLVRDPVGAYPLYYTTTGATRWIAPRLALLNPFHSKELDGVALRDYLCCAFVPGEQTLWKQVHKLRPGVCLQLKTGAAQTYWRLQESIEAADQPLEWHGRRLRSHLETVVQDCLPEAEPVGVYLSGGLDSSCITALAAQLHNHPVHTYSIHFGQDLPNELAFSSLVAEHCQTQHHILEISPSTLWRRLPETLAQLDEPIGDPLTVPNLILAEAAQQSVRAILNGEGGDPCFGGPKNQPMLLNRLYASSAEVDTSDHLKDWVSTYLLSFQKCAADLPNLLQPDLWRLVQAEPSVFASDLQDSSTSYLNRLMRLNIRFKGADQILTKVNNLTRAADLMGWSPLFDPRIVALSMTIPPTYKLAGAEEKAVLKAAVADLLPEEILRRPKSGMLVPVQYGFRQVWRAETKALLLNRKAAIAPYLNQTLIRQWLAYEGDIWGRYGVKLWLLTSLELWLRANL
ncbi:MAG: asparagine synthase-related protein [Leptolyngbyaceae cyanobacterium MO_188.B28]|nr:asparagine synthase-related protein [Leptolyngbyaceae cyanobacterium MO_188.B28]